ncbi:ATP-binding protein [Roseateles chitinivorans]|uniref:ATP-binding protein n=1 Tax=Roseateles chitinivorans TaxID=2917965 RepID=UPI003D67269E
MMRSIERELLAWIVGTLLLGSALVAMTTYVVTLDEMNEVFDNDLRNVAVGVATYHRSNAPHEQAHAPVLIPRDDEPQDSEIATFAWDASGTLIYSSDPRVPIRYVAKEGLSHPRIGGEDWIVYTAVHDRGIVQAAQRRASRREMAGESAAKILPFLLAMAVVVAGLLIYGLRRGLRPLDAAARDVAGRSARSLEAIDTSAVPAELLPMVRAINSLMAKLDQSFSAQRTFLADAAHELRTPIAALRLQLTLLERSADELERSAATASLKLGVMRAQRLIGQLLAVARTDPAGSLDPLLPVDLDELVRTVLEPFASAAEATGIDLGAELQGPAPVLGDTGQLAMLLDNLIENALRHTPAGGVVDVGTAMDDGRPVLFVRDSGPGIPAADRERVFGRFVRGDVNGNGNGGGGDVGSGLGLTIVKAIAERHGATVRLMDRAQGPGLEVRVCFPVAAPASGANAAALRQDS